jgi:hypothetical protein
MFQAGCQRRGDGHHRICGLQLRPPHLGAEQIGQMLNPAFANRLLAAAEEPPTAQ